MSTTPAAQVDTLARSVHLRYREALGEDIGDIPEGLYPGDYLKPVGSAARRRIWRPLRRRARRANGWSCSSARTVAAMLDLIRHDLGLLGIHHDIFASEAEVQQSGAVDRALATARATRGWSTRARSKPPKRQDERTIGSRSS